MQRLGDADSESNPKPSVSVERDGANADGYAAAAPGNAADRAFRCTDRAAEAAAAKDGAGKQNRNACGAAWTVRRCRSRGRNGAVTADPGASDEAGRGLETNQSAAGSQPHGAGRCANAKRRARRAGGAALVAACAVEHGERHASGQGKDHAGDLYPDDLV